MYEGGTEVYYEWVYNNRLKLSINQQSYLNDNQNKFIAQPLLDLEYVSIIDDTSMVSMELLIKPQFAPKLTTCSHVLKMYYYDIYFVKTISVLETYSSSHCTTRVGDPSRRKGASVRPCPVLHQ